MCTLLHDKVEKCIVKHSKELEKIQPSKKVSKKVKAQLN